MTVFLKVGLKGVSRQNKRNLRIFNFFHTSRDDGMHDRFNHGLSPVQGDGGRGDKKTYGMVTAN